MKAKTILLAKWSLAFVYLVILAGAVVRMTGSGMGCPDWPKCFGYLIPPTETEQLEWRPERTFQKGQVIVMDKQLWVAQSDFTTAIHFNKNNWKIYDKHEYAIFNVWHTWIEYINRLLGALAGLATLALLISSFWWWKEKKWITILSLLIVIGMGFQAWLGATVVYSVLAPVRITLHMLMALVIVGMLMVQIFNLDHKTLKLVPPKYRLLVGTALLLTLVQIILGTQVRQIIDHRIDEVGALAKDLWLSPAPLTFYIHRSISLLVLGLNLWLWWQYRKGIFSFPLINWVMVLIGLEVLTGIAMYYIDFPFGSQPMHLVLASLLFGVQFLLLLRVFKGSTFADKKND